MALGLTFGNRAILTRDHRLHGTVAFLFNVVLRRLKKPSHKLVYRMNTLCLLQRKTRHYRARNLLGDFRVNFMGRSKRIGKRSFRRILGHNARKNTIKHRTYPVNVRPCSLTLGNGILFVCSVTVKKLAVYVGVRSSYRRCSERREFQSAMFHKNGFGAETSVDYALRMEHIKRRKKRREKFLYFVPAELSAAALKILRKRHAREVFHNDVPCVIFGENTVNFAYAVGFVAVHKRFIQVGKFRKI